MTEVNQKHLQNFSRQKNKDHWIYAERLLLWKFWVHFGDIWFELQEINYQLLNIQFVE